MPIYKGECTRSVQQYYIVWHAYTMFEMNAAIHAFPTMLNIF